LSSYLLRLSKANGLSLLSLLNSIKTSRGHYVKQNDIGLIDFSPKSVVDTTRLANMVDLPEEKLLSLSFYYALKTFCSSDSVERTRVFSGMIRDHIYYCPKCLEGKLYFKLIWRIQDVNVCILHGIPLLNRCYSCGSLLKLHESALSQSCQCGSKLSFFENGKKTSTKELEYQAWLYQTWNTLLNLSDYYLNSSDVAVRILYILNSCQIVFDRDKVDAASVNSSPSLATLLQHARDSLSQKRTLHISFILKTLFDNQITMDQFLSMPIPQNFIDSVRREVVPKYDQHFCIAPWCSSYLNPGSLVKTGTSLRRLTSGELRYYYLACKKCGCEYALNKAGELAERTYFIEGYNRLKDIVFVEKSVKRLASESGFTEDKVRRCLAYFQSRNIFSEADNTTNLDFTLLNDFVSALEKGKTIKEVQTWNRWESYNHFLLHRFHSNVMQALIQVKRPRSHYNDSTVNRERVHQVLKQMLQGGKDITISSVSDIVGVSPETLRNWGCNQDIASVKNYQKEQRIQQMRNSLYNSIDKYFEIRKKVIVYSSELYQYLGKKRTVLWRISPEITSYVSEMVNQHNGKINKEL
jgi:hypothetical protein